MVLQLSLFLLASTLIIAFANEIGNFFKRLQSPIFNKPIVRHSVALIVLTALVFSFSHFLIIILGTLVNNYNKAVILLRDVINDAAISFPISSVLALLLLSIIPCLCVTGFYWVSHKKAFPYSYPLIWVSWLILVISIMLH